MTALLSSIELPAQIFTLEECADILLLEMHQDKTTLEEIYKTTENRYKISSPKKYNATLQRKNYMNQTEEVLQTETDEINNLYDQEWEKQMTGRLSKLDECSRNEFYRTRAAREGKADTLSSMELERLTLKAMERSFHYRNR